MVLFMRTTLTIDDDLALAIEDLRKREGLSFEAALNQVIRLGVQAISAPPVAEKYRTPTRALGPKPGIDAGRFNALADEIDAEVSSKGVGRS